MVARCPRTLSLGVVTCTTGRAIGSVVPHAEENVGAIATQATTNIFHGIQGMKLLKMGFAPVNVVRSTLALDPKPELRQILIVDSQGRTAAYTGNENENWHGHLERNDCVVGGNNLVGEKVLNAMIEMFENSKEAPLHRRLLEAIRAGYEAGGCNQPDHTAAIKVVGIEDELELPWRPFLDLRVDSSDDPIRELIDLYENYKKWIIEKHEQARRKGKV